MKKIYDEMKFFHALFDMLEVQMGELTELVLYELPSGKVVDIRNRHVSGGNASFGKRWDITDLSHTEDGLDILCNYIFTRSDGATLRCSGFYLFADDGSPAGAVCINQDITKTLELERALHNLTHNCGSEALPFVDSVNTALESLIENARDYVDKTYEEMDRETKIAFIRYLDDRGAFLVTKSSERICSLLNISKYTFYAYLDEIREDRQ